MATQEKVLQHAGRFVNESRSVWINNLPSNIEKREETAEVIAAESGEGDSHRSGMAVDEHIAMTEAMKKAMTLSYESPDEALAVGLQLAARSIPDDVEMVYFDLETTGFGREAEVLEIAALSDRGIYSAYIMPSGIIPWKVSTVTNIFVVGNDLQHNNVPVTCVPREEAWKNFIAYLETHEKGVVLVGHNVSFDARFTISETIRCQLLPNLSKSLIGFVDTLKVIRKCKPGLSSYKQGDLVRDVLGTDFTFSAHCASEDVRALKATINILKVNRETMLSSSMTLYDLLNKKTISNARDTLKPLEGKGLSKWILGKISKAGFNLNDLSNAHSTDTLQTVMATITKNNDILLKLKNCLDEIQNI